MGKEAGGQSVFVTVSCLTDDGLIDESDLREVMKACMVENGMQFDEKEVASLANALFEDAVQVSSANHQVLQTPDAVSQYLVLSVSCVPGHHHHHHHHHCVAGRLRRDHGGRPEGPANSARGPPREPHHLDRQMARPTKADCCQEIMVSKYQV